MGNSKSSYFYVLYSVYIIVLLCAEWWCPFFVLLTWNYKQDDVKGDSWEEMSLLSWDKRLHHLIHLHLSLFNLLTRFHIHMKTFHNQELFLFISTAYTMYRVIYKLNKDIFQHKSNISLWIIKVSICFSQSLYWLICEPRNLTEPFRYEVIFMPLSKKSKSIVYISNIN